jgi:hypothetical protein
MTGARRLQRMMLLVAAVTILLAVGAGVGHAGDSEKFWASSTPAVTAGSTMGAGAAGTLDPRLQRDIGAGGGHRSSRLDGLREPAVPGQWRGGSSAAVAAVLERAGHPERVGVILRRGPPGSST